jgi:isocitrate/isopropylmalate dehydrogenase
MTALLGVLTEGRTKTRDLGGSSTTTEFADAICKKLVSP